MLRRHLRAKPRAALHAEWGAVGRYLPYKRHSQASKAHKRYDWLDNGIIYDTIITMKRMQLDALTHFSSRRRALGMTFADLAKRSGVPAPTVKRMFGGLLGMASFANVAAVADALGVPLGVDESSVDEMRRSQARVKAERIARLVQGTSALESQAVDRETYERLVERSYHELLSGSSRRLWSE